jgi:predicted ester cyclase
LDGLDDVVDEHVVVLKPNGDVAFGDRETWKRAMADEPFADVTIDVEDMVCEDGKVAVRFRLACVQVAPVFGVEPSGRRIETSGTKVYRVNDGKIVEIAGHDDIVGVLQQLGLLELELEP